MKILYISYKLDNPRDQITLRGFEEIGIVVKKLEFKGYRNLLKEFLKYKKECDIVVIGYASSVLIIFLRLFTRKKIIYNALATFYDSMVVSRGGNIIWYWLIDFLAFNCADKVFLECQAQKDLVIKVFRINPDKISVHFVGTDERQFFFDPSIPKKSIFTAVFRGMFLAEAGADIVVKAAKELEDRGVNVVIIGRGLLKEKIENLVAELHPTNLELITEKLPIEILRQKMLACHVSLGQLANHPRVHTTVPHKVFESMNMRLPYLTGNNKGVMEFLREGQTTFTILPGDYHALAQKLFELKDQSQKLNEIAQNAYDLYNREFTTKILAQKIVSEIAL